MFKRLLKYRPLIVAWFWTALIPPAFLWWQESVPFLVAMSLYANIEASFATHAGKKGAREQQEMFDEMRSELDELLRLARLQGGLADADSDENPLTS